jgi:hypothetical protein
MGCSPLNIERHKNKIIGYNGLGEEGLTLQKKKLWFLWLGVAMDA